MDWYGKHGLGGSWQRFKQLSLRWGNMTRSESIDFCTRACSLEDEVRIRNLNLSIRCTYLLIMYLKTQGINKSGGRCSGT